MQKTIKNRQLNDFTGANGALIAIDYKQKNLLSIRCEKLLKKINGIGEKVNKKIQDKREEYCSKDDKGNFLYEQVTITDKNGASKAENTGNLKFTYGKKQELDKAIEEIMDTDVNIPVYLIENKEDNHPLYKQIFEKYSTTVISTLAGIILDVPVDEEGFVQEEFVMKMTSDEKVKQNGHTEEKKEAIVQ